MTDSRHERLHSARLYLVCGALSDDHLEAALRGGVDLVQLRIKNAADEELLATAGRYRDACDRHGALLILNDRPDLAAAAQADGVHVGQDDIDVPAARELVGRGRLIGLSTHSPTQIEAAREADVDYIGVGPVHATPTKPGREPVGIELVHYAAERSARPFFAIGGIDSTTIGAVVAAGARRVAVVRALTETTDPEQVARQLRSAITTRASEVPVGSA